jgi:hypothetical protein
MFALPKKIGMGCGGGRSGDVDVVLDDDGQAGKRSELYASTATLID